MINNEDEFSIVYEKVKRDTKLSAGRQVVIFVSLLEVDSVCALKILEIILEKDDVQYSVHPVKSYDEVKRAADKLGLTTDCSGSDTKHVFLINFGACEDMSAFLKFLPDIQLIVIDSHRLINHNLQKQKGVAVISFSDDVQLTGRGTDGMPEPDGASEAEISDDERDNGENEEPAGKRQKSDSSGQHQRAARRERRRRRRHEVRQQRADYYRKGRFWARPAALCMLHLAQSLQKENKTTFWLAAVALADQLVHQRISLEKYRECADRLHDQITACGGSEEQRIGIQGEGIDGNVVMATVKNPVMRIELIDDFQFPLLRSWTLYDAMLHAPKIALQLQTYTEKGRRKLEALLAKLGFLLSDCKRSFGIMPDSFTSTLKKRLQEKAPELGDLCHSGFLLHWGYCTPFSATDAVYAITALLESHSIRSGSRIVTPRDAFWCASIKMSRPSNAAEALQPGNESKLKAGLEAAKTLQRAILRESGQVITNSNVKSLCEVFCFVDLSSHSTSNPDLFRQPMALTKLGMFLRERRAWTGRRNPDKAIVIVSPEDNANRCQLLCITGQPKITDTKGNQMLDLLGATAEKMGCDINNDSINEVPTVPKDLVVTLLQEMAVQASTTFRGVLTGGNTGAV